MDAVVDWGAAQDYVRAMWLMLQQEAPEDYIVASGTGRTVREFARQAFASAGVSDEGLVRQDPAGRHSATSPMVGDSAKLQRQTGWRAEISFEAMVSAMVSTQQRSLRGDSG
jgi:GDPmannose 4,6-dehydratase